MLLSFKMCVNLCQSTAIKFLETHVICGRLTVRLIAINVNVSFCKRLLNLTFHFMFKWFRINYMRQCPHLGFFFFKYFKLSTRCHFYNLFALKFNGISNFMMLYVKSISIRTAAREPHQKCVYLFNFLRLICASVSVISVTKMVVITTVKTDQRRSILFNDWLFCDE